MAGARRRRDGQQPRRRHPQWPWLRSRQSVLAQGLQIPSVAPVGEGGFEKPAQVLDVLLQVRLCERPIDGGVDGFSVDRLLCPSIARRVSRQGILVSLGGGNKHALSPICLRPIEGQLAETLGRGGVSDQGGRRANSRLGVDILGRSPLVIG